jgi:toxin ParE1/3/4
MTKHVRLRQLAADDIGAAVDFYLAEAGNEVSGGFIDAVEGALGHVGRHPHNGSLRFSYELDIPDLRAWALPRFPYLVFYVDKDSHVDVWRVLHSRRDIPASLAEDDTR